MRRSTPPLAALLLVASALPAGAIPMPELMTEIGRSFAVDSPKSGVFDQGGFSMALSALWPVEDFLRIGASFFADDLGSFTGELFDESQSPPVSLGVFDFAHANVYGGKWRMEVLGPRLRRLNTFARGDFGAYKFRTDQYGTVLTESVKVGWALGGGIMLPLRENHAVGITVAFDRVFSNFTRDYMTADLAWHWRPGIRPHASGSKH
jgi:hypothetical protein